MAGPGKVPRPEIAIGGTGDQCKAGNRRYPKRREVHYPGSRALPAARQAEPDYGGSARAKSTDGGAKGQCGSTSESVGLNEDRQFLGILLQVFGVRVYPPPRSFRPKSAQAIHYRWPKENVEAKERQKSA